MNSRNFFDHQIFHTFNRIKTKRQIADDLSLALQLSSEEVWKKPATSWEATETDENGACCSKNIIQKPEKSIPKNLTTSVDDDEVIAQLLQAEFDLEFDEDLKRLEQSRNKSE